MAPALVVAWFVVLRFGPGIVWQPEPMVVEVGPVVLGAGVLAMLGSASVIIVVQRRAGPACRGAACRGILALACAGVVAAVPTVLVLVCCRAAVAPHTVSWPLYAGPLVASLSLFALTWADAAAVVGRVRA